MSSELPPENKIAGVAFTLAVLLFAFWITIFVLREFLAFYF